MQTIHITDAHSRPFLTWEILSEHCSGLPVMSTCPTDCVPSPKSVNKIAAPQAIVKSIFYISDIAATSITVSWNLSDEVADMRTRLSSGAGSNQPSVSMALTAIRNSTKDVKVTIVLSMSSLTDIKNVSKMPSEQEQSDKWIHQTTDITGSFCIEGLSPDTKYSFGLSMRWNISNFGLSSSAAGPSSSLNVSPGTIPGSLASRLMRSAVASQSSESRSGATSPGQGSAMIIGERELSFASGGNKGRNIFEATAAAPELTQPVRVQNPDGESTPDNLELDGALQTTAFSLSNSRSAPNKYSRLPQAAENGSIQQLEGAPQSAGHDEASMLAATTGFNDESNNDAVPDSAKFSCLSSMALIAATDSEPLFLLDKASLPQSLILGQNALTVRNKTNKKWSTVRATMRLMSGVHKWGVHIDRCISKNIFVGVVTEDARSDNYVGCDRFGWAFLANRAVWHNKAKIRSYGELFVTGDMIVVTLNMDLGTLSFNLNGKDLGVAVEGMSGPLYPAFSLYNEDDQLTLVPMKMVNPLSDNFIAGGIPSISAPSDLDFGDSSKNETFTSHTTENLYDRIGVLENLMNFIDNGTDAESVDLNNDFLCEAYIRWMRWLRRGGTRTICSSAGLIVAVSMCDEDIFNFFPPFTDVVFSAGETVQWDDFYVVVIGVGSHRLWFQSLESGNVSGLSRQALAQLQARGVIRPVSESKKMTAENILQLKDHPALQDCSHSNTFLEFCSTVQKHRIRWTEDLDKRLLRWLEATARKIGVHVCNLTYYDVVSPSKAVDKAVLHHSSDILRKFCDEFRPLCVIALREIRLRALLLISINDMIIPLMPLLPKPGHCVASSSGNFALRMARSKHLFFRQVSFF